MGGIGVFFVLIFWAISLAVFYLIIKAAVRNGVLDAHQELIESVRAIEHNLDAKKSTE